MPRYSLNTTPGLLAILIRHASTAANDPDNPQVRGWADDELSNEGRVEAQLTAEKLKQYDLKRLIHSDFMRDSQTAHIIASILNIPVEADFDARTFDTGLYSKKSEAEVNPAIAELYKRPWESAPGGSESFNGFLERWRMFLEAKFELATIPSMRPIGIVTHGRCIAATHSYIEDVPLLEAKMPYPAGFALISVGLDRSLNFEIVPPTEPVIQDV